MFDVLESIFNWVSGQNGFAKLLAWTGSISLMIAGICFSLLFVIKNLSGESEIKNNDNEVIETAEKQKDKTNSTIIINSENNSENIRNINNSFSLINMRDFFSSLFNNNTLSKVLIKDNKPTIHEPNTVKNPTQWKIYEYSASDDNGHNFDFNIYILGDEFNWFYRSCNTITFGNNEKFNLTELTKYIESIGVQYKLKNAKDIITVGLASQEIMKNAPDEEIAIDFENMRAFRRARNLKLLTEKNTETNANFHKLTLGKYTNYSETNTDNPSQTSMQRRIIIIAIFDRDENVKLGELLPQILPKVESFPINLSDYELFKLGDIDFSHLYNSKYDGLMEEFNKYCYD